MFFGYEPSVSPVAFPIFAASPLRYYASCSRFGDRSEEGLASSPSRLLQTEGGLVDLVKAKKIILAEIRVKIKKSENDIKAADELFDIKAADELLSEDFDSGSSLFASSDSGSSSSDVPASLHLLVTTRWARL